MKADPRVDAYIARQGDFARPVLETLRERVHAACPDIEEAIKWGAPAFLYKGKQLAMMAAFKAHAAFNFWHGTLVTGKGSKNPDAMGQFGRLGSVEDLPEPKRFEAMVRKAAALIDTGVKPPRGKAAKAPLETPEDLKSALAASPAAAACFDGFSQSCRREYVEWIVEAKRPETREKRIAQAMEWMAEGKKRNWKYESC